ncbi:MAG: hypothetical protein JSS02_15100 [Planctomycetes bacterium]|nr:hypothetical protein [Planctomycetota bacterium]
MNTAQRPDDNDPWEELADLVGLEGGKEYIAATSPPETPVEATRKAESVVFSDTPAAPPAPTKSAGKAPVVFSEALFDDVVFDDSDEPPASPQAASQPAVSPEPAAVEEPTPAPATPAATVQDSYWDALANWNWDDSDDSRSRATPEPEATTPAAPAPRSEDRERGGDRDRPRERRRDDRRDDRRGRRGDDRGARPARGGSGQSASASRSAPPPRAPRSGDEFGLGLDDEPPAETPRRPVARDASDDEIDEPTTLNQPDGDTGADDGDDADGNRRRRRRRRRGGRGRGDRESVAGTPGEAAAPAPAHDWDDETGPEADFSEAPETPPAPAQAPVEGGSGERSGRPPRGKRRDGRRERGNNRRGGGSDRAERSDVSFDEDEPQEITSGGGMASPHFGESDEDDVSEPVISYDNVPSWEEAISYLLHPNQVQVEGGSEGVSNNPPARGPSSSGQPRQTRHYGDRKPRR